MRKRERESEGERKGEVRGRKSRRDREGYTEIEERVG